MNKQPSWVDALLKATDKTGEVIIHSASTLHADGTSTEYYNRERDGHKELSELLPQLPDADDISLIDKLYQSPEERILELEEALNIAYVQIECYKEEVETLQEAFIKSEDERMKLTMLNKPNNY